MGTTALQGYYINLNRGVARRHHIETQLVKYNLTGLFLRHPGVEGSALPRISQTLTPSELGCFMSHYSILKRSAKNGKNIHIIEDDVVFSCHTLPVLTFLLEKGVMSEWDIIFTDTFVPINIDLIREYKQLLENCVEREKSGQIRSIRTVQLLDLRKRHFGAASSYVVGAKSVNKVLSVLEAAVARGPDKPLDLYLRQKIYSGEIRAACVFPFVTSIHLGLSMDTTIPDRYESNLPVLACDILRHSFFVDCDWRACQDVLMKRFQAANPDDVHEKVLSAILRFGISAGNIPF